MLRSNVGVWTKMEDSNYVSEDPEVKIRVINIQKIRLPLAFFEEKAESLCGRGWWFCIERGAAALEDLIVLIFLSKWVVPKGRDYVWMHYLFCYFKGGQFDNLTHCQNWVLVD